jgi:phage shock protein A
MPPASTVEAHNKKLGRSRLTNGRDLLPSVDGRSTWARLMRDSLAAMMTHLGGEDYVTEPQRMLSRRAAAMEAELIHLEDAFARARSEGRAPEMEALDLYSRMSSAQRRVLEAIGLGRVARDVTPDPLTYARDLTARRTAEKTAP